MAERESDQAIKDRQDAELKAERQERRARLGHEDLEKESKPKRGRPKGSANKPKEEEEEAESEA